MENLRRRPRIVVLLSGVLVLLAGQAFAAVPAARAATCPVAGPVDVVLDPGHGGTDPGASNAKYGLIEEHLTLDIAFRARTILEGRSVSVALTREGDVGLGNSDRGEIANACGARVFVSIHFNSSTNVNINYTKTFWGKKRKDLAFSQAIHDALWPTLATDAAGNPTNLTDGKVGQFATGSLLHATMPGTLAETVFLSNDAEAARLASSDGARRAQIAAAVAAGVEGWLATHPRG